MPHEIRKPSQLTYYIITDGEVKHHGCVKTTQRMSSGMGGTMETFTDKTAYETRCAELGIVLEEEDEI